MRKIIFLDFDGVINGHFNEWNAIQNVNKIIKNCNADIVISSNWRYTNSLPALKTYLYGMGVECDHIDMIPVLYMYDDILNSVSTKEREIVEYLKSQDDVIKFVIFDDFNLNVGDYQSNFIFVKNGLSDKETDVAINILNG